MISSLSVGVYVVNCRIKLFFMTNYFDRKFSRKFTKLLALNYFIVMPGIDSNDNGALWLIFVFDIEACKID